MNAVNHDFETQRQAMVVSQLRPSGVSDSRVVEAMASVPRELFVPAERTASAYVDRPVPLGNGRSLMPGLPLGLMLTEARTQETGKALVVGGATGYSAAVLARLVAKVVLLESDEVLATQASAALAAAGVSNVEVITGALEAGWSQAAPYDVILLDGAVENVPEALGAQLAEGGRIVYPQAVPGSMTRLSVGTRAAGHTAAVSFADVDTPSLPGFARPRGFTF